MPATLLDSNTVPATADALYRRQFVGPGYEYYDYDSAWDRWGRWVFLGVVVALFLIVFIIVSCWQARRRRTYGQRPIYGTGWMAPQQGYNGHNQQWPGNYPQQENNFQPPPSYGYYGAPAPNYELSSPPNAYQRQAGGESVYTTPADAPPRKGDIVR